MDKIDLKIGTKEEALWTDVKKQAENELCNIEDTYFKVKTFQEAIIEMCEQKLQKIALESDNRDGT